MNKTYRLVWSDVQQAWVVTHEHVKSRGKRSGGRVGALIAGALLSPVLAAAQTAPPVNALPTGGQVVAGQAAISQAGSTMNIQQATQKAILNWQSFNIGANATVNFQQPSASAVALNRVIGQDPSAIFGNLNANGQVFLVNPNGVLFGPGARVDVGGLVATTMNIRNEDFLAGNYRFFRDGATGSVINRGNLTGGYLALLAPEVRNEGVILARMGTAALAGGDAVTLGITGENRVDIRVDKATINTLIENRHLIQVDGGRVVLSAQSVADLLGEVVNSGGIEANSLVADGGSVRLAASHTINHSGTISANAGTNGRGGEVIVIADLANPASRTDVSGSISARGGSQSGDGGFIETSANRLRITDSAVIDTRAPFGVTGQWLLDPYDFTIAAANGDITGSALGTALASNNVTIQTLDASVSCTNATCGTGNSSGNGDIFVNDSVTWASDKTLTLSAWRNIHINAPVNVNGSGGGLALHFAQSDTAANFPTGIYTVSAPVNLAAGATFSTKAATDGPVINYTVIRNATQLAAISSGLAGNYVLGTDITAPVSSWTPIGNTATPFAGIFDGLGHKVVGLQHTNSGADVDVGLFGGSTGLIQNVGVTNVNIAGSQNVGALVGFNNGFVVNSYATGTVQGTGTGDVGRIGGLVGYSQGPILGSYANVAVTATTGNQTGDPFADGRGGIGGLAGVVTTAVNDSYARGAVTGINAVGGLVGYSLAGISNTYATGAVSGSTNVNGLIGQVADPFAFTPFVFNSFWDTTTSGQITGGGGAADLITGLATAQMQTKSTFDSSGAGWDTNVAWELRNGQYPLLKPMLRPVYVIADNKTSTFDGNPFAAFTSTTGPSGTPGGATTGTVTFTPSTANPTNAGTYTVTPGGVSVAAAGAGDQHGYRVEFVNGTLTITPAVLTTTITGSLVGSVSKVYDGSSTITGLTNANFSLSGWQGSDGATVTKTTGTITDGPNASASTTRPVTVTLALSDYVATGSTNFSNYTLPTSVSGNIGQITPKTLTVTGSTAAGRTYDATTAAAITVGTLSGFVGTETVTATATGVFDSKDAGARTATATYTLVDGTNGGLAGNYALAATTGHAATITQKTLTVSGLSVPASRVYNASTSAVVSGTPTLQTAIAPGSGNSSDGKPYSGDTITLTGTATGTYNSKDVANASTVTFGGVTQGNSNYVLDLGTQAATITKAQLTVTADNQTRTFGAANPVFTQTITGFVGGENLATSGVTGAATTFGSSTANASTNVGTAVITASAAGLSAANYDFTNLVNGTLTITPAALSILNTSASKTYDGTNVFNSTHSYILTGMVNGDPMPSVTSGTATVSSKNAGTYNSFVTNSLALSNSNYTLSGGTISATINPKTLTVTGSTAAGRTYDATTAAAITVGTLSGFVGTETVTATATGVFDSKDAGARTATATYTLVDGTNGGLASNYALAATTGHAATITQKTLTVSGLSVPASRVYNGNTSAVVSGTPTLQTAIAPGSGSSSDGKPYSGDTITLTGTATGTYNSKDVANANLVTFGGVTQGNSNYVLDLGTQAATITRANLVLSGSRVYDNTTVVAGSILTATGVNGESFTITGSGSVGSANVQLSGGNVTHQPLTALGTLALGTPSGGALAGNYNPIADTALTVTGSQITIERKEVSVFAFPQPSSLGGTSIGTPFSVNGSGLFVDKAARFYDGSNTYTPGDTVRPRDGATTANDGLAYNGDDVSLSSATITFNSNQKNVGIGTVTISGASLTGNEANNYRLPATPLTAPGEIIRRPVLLSATKTYDATNTLTGSQVTISNLVNNETLSFSGATADSKDVQNIGNNNYITAITLENGSGPNAGLASNYQLPNPLSRFNAPVMITPKALSVASTNVSLGEIPINARGDTQLSGSPDLPLGKTFPVSSDDLTRLATQLPLVGLATPIAPGTGTPSDGRPYSGDSITVTGSPGINGWTILGGTYPINPEQKRYTVTSTLTGLTLTGAQAGNYTLDGGTGTSVSATITASASVRPVQVSVVINNVIRDTVESSQESKDALAKAIADLFGSDTTRFSRITFSSE